MIELILACLNMILTMSMGIWMIKRAIPDMIQSVLNDVGVQLKTAFADPMVKKGMSIIGKQSGEARASRALQNKVADKVIGQSPVIERVLEEFDLTPLEGLQILNDPILGPLIKPHVQKFLSGIPGTANPQPNPRQQAYGEF